MKVLTKQFLKNEYSKIPYEKRMQYNNKTFEVKENYDVFISHSYLDRELVDALYSKFEECGYKVFIDWKNDSLKDREKVDVRVALKLKIYMAQSKGLLYISTENSSDSKWCPWELGYVDGLKSRVAILPILDDNKNFIGQEYLSLYPYITYEKYENKDVYDFWVNDVINPKKYTTLKKWLETGKLSLHK